MGIRRTGSQRDSLLVDVCESWNGFHNVLTGNPQGQIGDARMGYDQGAGGSTLVLFANISGGLAPLTYDLTFGRVIHPYASLGGTISSISGGNGAGAYSIPMAASVVPALPSVLWPRPFRRYRLDFLVRGTVGPAAGVDCACGLALSNPQSLVTGGITDPTAHWSARNGVNGGAWTPRYRLAPAGAYALGPAGPAFVNPAVTQLSLEYQEGPIRRLLWLVNGAETFRLEDPNIPQSNGPPAFAKAKGLGLGTTCHYGESRFRVWEIG
jgi:hypothetical protein